MKEERSSLYQKAPFVLALALVCTALWGSASPAIKVSYEVFRIRPDDFFSKCLIAGIRFLTAGLLVLIYESIRSRKLVLPSKKELPALCGLGFVQTSLQYLLFYTGLAYTTGARGALFSSLDGFFIVLITPLVMKGSKLTPLKIAGCAVGLGGLILTSAGTNLRELAGFSLLGDGCVILSSLCFALSFFPAKKLMTRMSAPLVTGSQMVLGALILLLVGLLGGGKMYWGDPGPGLLVLGYLCLLSAIAYTLWSFLMQHNPINRVSILKLFTPIFGAVFSAMLLKETPFTPVHILALVLICSGIFMINREP